MKFKNPALLRILKFVVPFGLLLYLFFLVFKDWNIAYKYIQDLNFFYLLLSLPFFLIIYPEGAYCWFVILKFLKIKVSLINVLSVWVVSNTIRYIPGSVWQYLSRVFLSKNILKISKTDATASTILEIFFVLSGAVITSFFTLSVLKVFDARITYLLSSLIFIVLLFYSRVLRFFLYLLSKISKRSINIDSYEISFNDSLKITPFFVLNFIINGLAMYLLILSFNFELEVIHIFTLSGFYSLAWLLGYISFFSPGGLGITEVSLTYLLSLLIPIELSPIIAVFYRLLLTLAELTVFIFILSQREFKEKIFKYER